MPMEYLRGSRPTVPRFVFAPGGGVQEFPSAVSVDERDQVKPETGGALDVDKLLNDEATLPAPFAAVNELQARASEILLRLLGMAAEEDDDLLLMNKLRSGLDGAVVERLRASGVPASAVYDVVAPKRTVMRRKQLKERLTPGESDGAYRLARLLSLASVVLAGREAALAWLGRPKDALRGLTPWEAATTSLGFDRAAYLLWQLEAGNSA